MNEGNRPQLQMLWPERLRNAPPESSLPEGYRLRIYRPEDEDAYLALMQGAGFTSFDHDAVEQWLLKVLPDGFYLIEHCATGEIVATAMANHNPRRGHPFGGELGWVAGSRAHSGKGLGQAVCAAATARLLSAGYRRIYLLTDDWRLAAIKTYLRLGYVPYLCAPGMEARWRLVCAKLEWPARPERWIGQPSR
jgi:mycothiol synthase